MALLGIFTAWLTCVKAPAIRSFFSKSLAWLQAVLVAKYGFDTFYARVVVGGVQLLSRFFYQITDRKIIDTWIVDGSGKNVSWWSQRLRKLQTGYLYHYAFVMMLGLLALLCWFLFFRK